MNIERELTNKLQSLSSGSFIQKDKIREALKEICNYAGWPYGEAWRYDKKNNQMLFFTAWYMDANFSSYEKFSSICKFSPGVGLVGKALEKKEPVWMDDLLTDSNFIRTYAAAKSGFVYGYAVPLFNSGELTGMFSFFRNKQQHTDELNRKIISSSLTSLLFDF